MTPVLKSDPAKSAARFVASIRELARLTGYDQRTVARNEIGAILKHAAGRVKVAPDNTIPFRARLRAVKASLAGQSGSGKVMAGTSAGKSLYGITINTGRRGSVPGRVWFRTKNKKFQMIGGVVNDASYDRMDGQPRHIKTEDFNRASQGIGLYRNALRDAFPKLKNSIGLSRQSVVQMADALGIRLEDVPGAGASPEAIAKARSAIASNGQRYSNGSGSDNLDATGKYFARVMNGLPYNTRVRIDTIISSVMAARARRYASAHSSGVFDSVEKIRRWYPWVKLVGNPPALPSGD